MSQSPVGIAALTT
jgi:hypothetical protein